MKTNYKELKYINCIIIKDFFFCKRNNIYYCNLYSNYTFINYRILCYYIYFITDNKITSFCIEIVITIYFLAFVLLNNRKLSKKYVKIYILSSLFSFANVDFVLFL